MRDGAPFDVAGIDTGLTLIKRTSGVCRTGASGEIVGHTYIDRASRSAALGPAIVYSALAIDAPVLPGGHLDYSRRACERVFAWKPFQKRCKPGASHVSGTGQALRRAGVETAMAFFESVSSQDLAKAFPRVITGRNIVEAFPNAFLGVSLPASVFSVSLKRGVKFDWLYDTWLDQSAIKQLQGLLSWDREEFWRAVWQNKQHDERAALVCAMTAVCVLRGSYVAVGDERGGYFFLPPWSTWASWARQSLDSNRRDARLVTPVDVWIDGRRYSAHDDLPSGVG